MSTANSLAFIPFTCPHCGAFTEVELAYAGKSGPCFVCGRVIKVPYVTAGSQLQTIHAEGVSPLAVAAPTPVRSQLFSALFILLGACLLLGAIAAVGLKLAAPAVVALKKSAAVNETQVNLQRIVAALRAYESQYGSLPPPYTVDSQGKRLHSWRTLILPFLGEHGIYSQIKLNEPWDSTDNIRLASQIPSVYTCSIDPSAKALGETSYVVIVGPRTAFRDPTLNADEKTKDLEKIKLSEISDGVESTLLVAEYHGSGICWLEPKDLNFGRMSFNVNEDRSNTEMRSKHDGAVFGARASGKTIRMSEGSSSADIRAMLTIDGEEAIDWSEYEKDTIGNDNQP